MEMSYRWIRGQKKRLVANVVVYRFSGILQKVSHTCGPLPAILGNISWRRTGAWYNRVIEYLNIQFSFGLNAEGVHCNFEVVSASNSILSGTIFRPCCTPQILEFAENSRFRRFNGAPYRRRRSRFAHPKGNCEIALWIFMD